MSATLWMFHGWENYDTWHCLSLKLDSFNQLEVKLIGIDRFLTIFQINQIILQISIKFVNLICFCKKDSSFITQKQNWFVLVYVFLSKILVKSLQRSEFPEQCFIVKKTVTLVSIKRRFFSSIWNWKSFFFQISKFFKWVK